MRSRLTPLIAVLLSTPAAPVLWAAPPTPFRIVLDPGHGGGDQGTVYSNHAVRVAEKDATLKIAMEAARQLRAQGIEVILTRQSDREVPLGDRTALANRVKANLFLSIHLNSPPPILKDFSHARAGASAEGVETYILNTANEDSSRRLARLENSVLGGSPDRTEGQTTEVALILKDLRLDANLSESKRLACLIQNHVTQDRGPGSDRGVRQALFHVLLGADMPSALLEAGFLSSAKDRSQVVSPAGRKRLGKAITQAVVAFKQGQGLSLPYPALSRCKVR